MKSEELLPPSMVNDKLWNALRALKARLGAKASKNSTLFTAWETGFGLGIILGGMAAEYFSYGTAFWIAWLGNTLGVILFFAYTRQHFLRNKLR